MSIINALKWRYATKRMNGAKVPGDTLERILEAARLAPSSYGLQPYTIIVIEDPELRKKIQPLAYNQPQIAEASHILVFAAWDNVTPANVETFIHQVANERGLPADSLKGYQTMIENHVSGATPEVNRNWAARQAYIALGVALVAAAAEEVDATPMEGFNPVALDEALGLPAKGLRSVVLMALGYRDASTDPIVNLKKVRRDTSKLFITLP
jgi:nitroreductase